MMKIWKTFDLFLFDGGAAGGEGGGNAGGEGTGMAAASQRAENTPADAAQEQAGATRDMNAEWKKMINGEFKEQYQRDTQALINNRFRDHKTLQESNQKHQAIAERLARRYGKDAGDLDALSAALDGDMQWMQEKADQLGLTVEQYAQHIDQKEKAAKYDAIMDQRHQQEEKDRWYAQLTSEAEALKNKYSAFDIDNALQNPRFVNYVQHHMPMEDAWKATFFDEAMEGVVEHARQDAERQTVENIRARGMRPQEGAAGGGTAVKQATNVSNMTKEQREEMNRLALRGVKVDPATWAFK